MLLALGVTAIVLFARHVGVARLMVALRATAVVLPFVFLLEGARIVLDAWRTRLLYGRAGRVTRFGRILRTQLAAYPIALLVPAGGAASEAFKAAELSDEAGPDVAAATATINQALVLFAGFLISIPCFVTASLVWGAGGLTVAIGVQAATALGLGLFIQLGTRQAFVGRLLARFSKRAGEAVGSYQTAVVEMRFLPVQPLGAAVASRCAQLVQLAILAWAVGGHISIASAFIALGVQLVGSAAGDMVPAQIGALDASFAIASSSLGVDTARALAIPIVMHVVQLGWAVIGALLPQRPRPKPGHDASTVALIPPRPSRA